jgi:hypothetical protein
MTYDFDESASSGEKEEAFFEDLEDSIIIGDSLEEEKKEEPGNRNFIVAVSILGGGFLIVLIALIVFAAMILPQRSQAAREQAAQTAEAHNQEMAAGLAEAASATLEPSATLEAPTATITEVGLEVMDTEPSTPEAVEPPEEELPSPGEGSSEGPGAEEPALPTLTNTFPVAEALSTEEKEATLDYLLTMLASCETPVGTEAPPGSADAASSPVVQSEAMTSTAEAAGVEGGAATPYVLPDTGFADDFGLPLLIGSATLLVIIIIVARRLRLSRNRE